MSTGEHPDPPAGTTVDESAEGASPAQEQQGEEKHKLELDVQISDTGPCKKHIKVTIPRTEVDRQFEESLGKLRREAAIPGFRPGRAPKQLVERRYRKDVSGQVKSALLMACLEQLDEDYKLNPISQPNLDPEAIELTDDGPMMFEMDLEVQPDFPLPEYKNLTVKRPVKTISEVDVDAQLHSYLERHADLVPKLEGGAEPGDYVTANLRFQTGGVVLNEAKEVQFRVLPTLRFQDGEVPRLVEALSGARPGDVREADAQIGTSSPDPAVRGKTIQVLFSVLDLKRLRMPEINRAFLEELGFDEIDELREAVRESLERRLAFQQRQAVRQEIVNHLVQRTPFDLPEELVARQEQATLQRRVMEMREGGLSEAQIRAREAELRANAHESTLQSLKEYFVLVKIAEAEDIKVEDSDFEQEIEALAARNDESARRVRARVEKEGLAEALASQILERKTIDKILEYVTIEDVPLVEEKPVETVDRTASTAPAEPEEAPAATEASSTGGEST